MSYDHITFPVKPSYENVSERSLVHIEKNIEEEKIDALFHKSSQKRNSSRPVVIMVDSNEEFRSYLETCLSEEYIVRGFETERTHWDISKMNIRIW